ncbi:hypothetical protein C3L33_16285, partial [Rhododendron williamsianum]
MIDMTWFSALLVGAGCFALGYLLSARYPACKFVSTRVAKETSAVDGNEKSRPKEPLEIEKLADILEDFKMVLVVRNDLKMGKGKISAQCSHATLGLYKKLLRRAPKSLNRWEMCGQVKVVVKIENEEDLLVLQQRKIYMLHTLCLYGLLSSVIAFTFCFCQSAKELLYSRTVMAIMGPADMVDDVTGGLKLL